MSGAPQSVYKKYTKGSSGVWEWVRKTLSLVPNRSSGTPIVNMYRSPSPASVAENRQYERPITLPARDIAGNPYFKRDNRRNFPRVISFDQTKMSGLLTLGSVSVPRISAGDQGTKELERFQNGNLQLLSTTLSEIDPTVLKGQILGPQGEPIVAPSMNRSGTKTVVLQDSTSHGMYSSEYPVRMFSVTKG